MEFSTIYGVCVGNGRPFKLTREMLDAIEERMKQNNETTAATQLVKMLGERRFQDLVAHGRESQEDTGVDFNIALVPDKNLLHVPLRNCNRAQL